MSLEFRLLEADRNKFGPRKYLAGIADLKGQAGLSECIIRSISSIACKSSSIESKSPWFFEHEGGVKTQQCFSKPLGGNWAPECRSF